MTNLTEILDHWKKKQIMIQKHHDLDDACIDVLSDRELRIHKARGSLLKQADAMARLVEELYTEYWVLLLIPTSDHKWLKKRSKIRINNLIAEIKKEHDY